MLIKGCNFTIGADPEIFIKDRAGWISAGGLIEGTKSEPKKVKHGAVQVDGTALEFNIDPANNFEEFDHNLTEVSNQLLQMVQNNYAYGAIEFMEAQHVLFDDEERMFLSPEELVLGCEPDMNAWIMSPNPSPNGDINMRTAGGHIHVGGFEGDEWDEDHVNQGGRLARLMDEEVGVYSILFDEDDDRRRLYGKAGAFRPKPYGMEYRSLSNKWLFSTKLRKFVFDRTIRAIERWVDGEDVDNKDKMIIINTSDRDNDFFKNNPVVKQLMEA